MLHRRLVHRPWCLRSLPSGALPAHMGTAAVPAVSAGTLCQVGDPRWWRWLVAQSRGLVPQNLSQSHKTRPMGYGKVLLVFFSQGTCSVLLNLSRQEPLVVLCLC